MRSAALALLGALAGGVSGCDADDALKPGAADMAVDAEVITGRPDFEPPPAPAPTPEMSAAIDAFDGRVAVFARNLDSGETLAHEAEIRFGAGGLSALLSTIAWAHAVQAGEVAPRQMVQVRPADVRGGGLGRADAGQVYPLDVLVARSLAGDRTAEHLVTHALGGPDAVNAALVDLDLDGIGRYLDPCERDRLWAEALDPRFASADCDDLGLWVHAGSTAGLVPRPFATVPTFDAEQRAAAAQARLQSGAGTGTARAWAALLARLDAGRLHSPPVDARVRALLDAGRAAGGGDDGLPASVWSGSLEGRAEDGRHWIGRLRTPDGEPMVLVVLTSQTEAEADVDRLTRALGSGAWNALVGPFPWPPPDPADPPAAAAHLLPSEASDACDVQPGGYEGQLRCRSEAAAEVFEVGDSVTATLLTPGPGPVEAAWTWSAPVEGRTRVQQVLGPSAWWVWSETRRVFTPGDWTVTLSADGEVVRTIPFTVVAAEAAGEQGE